MGARVRIATKPARDARAVTNVPQTVCEEVPDPPTPPLDQEKKLRLLHENCELAKSAAGEEKGQQLCQMLIRAHSQCASSGTEAAYSQCMQAQSPK